MHTGSGLGLYSVRRKAAGLDGTCGVTDNPCSQGGSIFFFAVPYMPDRTEVRVCVCVVCVLCALAVCVVTGFAVVTVEGINKYNALWSVSPFPNFGYSFLSFWNRSLPTIDLLVCTAVNLHGLSV